MKDWEMKNLDTGTQAGRGKKVGVDERRNIIASRLKFARIQNGLSQKQLGRLLNVSDATISTIEKGKQKLDTIRLEKAARILGRSVRWFYGDAVEENSFRPPDILLTELQERIKNYISVYDGVGEGAEIVDSVPVLDTGKDISVLRAYRIEGLNCQPMVQENDIVVVDTSESPERGDYILFSTNGRVWCGLYDEIDGKPTITHPFESCSFLDCHIIGKVVQLIRRFS